MSGDTIIAVVYSVGGFDIEGFSVGGFDVEAYNSILVDSVRAFCDDKVIALEVIALRAYRNIISSLYSYIRSIA